MIDAPFVSFDHSCEWERLTLPESFTFFVSRLSGTPIWECRDCRAHFTYVECLCDLAHYCHAR